MWFIFVLLSSQNSPFSRPLVPIGPQIVVTLVPLLQIISRTSEQVGVAVTLCKTSPILGEFFLSVDFLRTSRGAKMVPYLDHDRLFRSSIASFIPSLHSMLYTYSVDSVTVQTWSWASFGVQIPEGTALNRLPSSEFLA